MSYAILTATVSGYCTSAQLKTTTNGNEVLSFKVPVETAKGVQTWYQIDFWNGDLAKALNRFGDIESIKGAKITLSGSYKVTTWQSANGSGLNHVISNPQIIEFYPKPQSDEDGDDTQPIYMQPRTDNPYEGVEQSS